MNEISAFNLYDASSLIATFLTLRRTILVILGAKLDHKMAKFFRVLYLKMMATQMKVEMLF